VSKFDLQDKQKWCKLGEELEARFLKEEAVRYGFDLILHPNKSKDKCETDFQLRNGKLDVDLKHMSVPFFKAQTYGIDPNKAFTINHKDYLRYSYKYPTFLGDDMVMLLWLEVEADIKFGVPVSRKYGLWSLRLSKFDELIRNRMIPCHSYKDRKDCTDSNAKHSWIVDLDYCTEHEVINE